MATDDRPDSALTAAKSAPRPAGQKTPLARAGWRYVARPTLDDMTAADWRQLQPQREAFYAEHMATRALDMLASQHAGLSYGYPLSTYEHCLQTATRVMRDGHDEQTIVAALFHDICLELCDANHGRAAAEMLRPFISARNYWMLQHHDVFIYAHCASAPGADPNVRERWRGHPHFSWTAEFVDKYDQRSMCPDYDSAPLAVFEPIVRRVLAKPVNTIPPPPP